MKLSDITWKDAESLSRETVFFMSLSPLEAHGPHLPLSTDLLISQAIEKETISNLEKIGYSCVSLPSLPFGVCHFLKGFTGTLNIRGRTLFLILDDIFKTIGTYGFSNLILINFHMDLWHIKAIYKACKKARRYGLNVYEPISNYYFRNKLFTKKSKYEIHADIKETSLMLYLFPNLVKNIDIEKVEIKLNLTNSLKNFFDIGAKDGYIGNPAMASEDYGFELYQSLIKKSTEGAIKSLKGELPKLPKKIRLLLKV